MIGDVTVTPFDAAAIMVSVIVQGGSIERSLYRQSRRTESATV